MRGAARRKSTRKNNKVARKGRKTVRSKTARKQRLRRTRASVIAYPFSNFLGINYTPVEIQAGRGKPYRRPN